MAFYRSTVPSFLVGICSIILLMDYYVPSAPVKFAADQLTTWVIIILGFMMMAGSVSVLAWNGRYITERKPGQFKYAVLLIATTIVFIVIGTVQTPSAPSYVWLFENLLTPTSLAIFALMVFYTASACYRAFRARSAEAAILLTVGIIVILTQAPIGGAISAYIPSLGNWIMEVPNMAGQRALLIGTALGAAGVGLRLIIGRERGFLSRAE